MRRNMDAFIKAAEAARSRLISREGADVSWREVIRRADRMDKRGTIMHHLNRRLWDESRPHRVPLEVVSILGGALDATDDLTRAAQAAAGYNVVDDSRPDVTVFARYLESSEVSDDEKNEVIAEILAALQDTIGRRARPVSNGV